MDDSASYTTHDEINPAFYKISPEDMCDMKRSLELIESDLNHLHTTKGRTPIGITLHELELFKATIAKAEPASENMYVTRRDFASMNILLIIQNYS